MPTATNDTYIAASGADVYAGRYAPNPAWLAALSTLTWTQIGSNKITDVNPANDAAINPVYPSTPVWTPSGSLSGAASDYSGGALDDVNGRMWFCGGGHAGYKGNEAYSIDLEADLPQWIRRGYPSGSIQHTIASVDANGANASLLTDGRPHQVHTYNLLSCLPNGDLVLCPGGYQWAGSASPYGYRFDHSADDWDTATAFAITTYGSPNSGSSCYDAVRDVVWCFNGTGVVSYDPATGTKTEHFNTSGNQSGYYSCMVHDTLRDLIVVFLGQAGSGPFASAYVLYFNPASPTAFTIAPQDTTTRRGTHGIGYDAAADRYLTWERSGNNLTIITPPASSPGTNTWVSSTLTCSGTLTAAAANGNYGRFRVSDKYNCAFLLNATGEKLYALKLR